MLIGFLHAVVEGAVGPRLLRPRAGSAGIQHTRTARKMRLVLSRVSTSHLLGSQDSTRSKVEKILNMWSGCWWNPPAVSRVAMPRSYL